MAGAPCHDVLADVMMLQEMQRTFLRALHKQVDPPTQSPPGTKMLDLRPNRVTEVQMSRDAAVRPLYEIKPDLRSAYQQILDTRAAINEALYIDLFITTADPSPGARTAYEIAKRHEEKLMMLGPTTERLQSDTLNPALDRTFYIMARQNLLPPPPEELAGADLQIDYISILAQAQKMVALEGVRGVTAFAAELAPLKPEVLDKLNGDQAMDEYSRMIGAPAKMMLSDEEVAQIRNQRAQEQAAMQQQAALAEQVALAGEAAKAGKTLGETDLGGQNALEAVGQAMGMTR
jgi:hypothetical protein